MRPHLGYANEFSTEAAWLDPLVRSSFERKVCELEVKALPHPSYYQHSPMNHNALMSVSTVPASCLLCMVTAEDPLSVALLRK